MKNRFSTYDLICSVTELQKLIGMRVAQVYDIDHKTYLIKLQRTEEKAILLLESGNRIHTTAFEWPKNVAPSGFSMKMRKHLKNKRLESMRQLGMDRIVDLQFGSGEVAYHIILELYDRGNIILTDCDLTIINILRPHTEGELVRFAVREKYPVGRAHEQSGAPSEDKLKDILSSAKVGEGLKKILNPHLEYGPAIIDHVLLKAGFPSNCKLGKGFSLSEDLPKLCAALDEAEQLMIQAAQEASKGYIIQKREKRPLQDGTEEDLFSNQEFHPMVFLQHCNQPYKEFDSFDMAVDEFFSNLEGQKIDMKTLQQLHWRCVANRCAVSCMCTTGCSWHFHLRQRVRLILWQDGTSYWILEQEGLVLLLSEHGWFNIGHRPREWRYLRWACDILICFYSL